jgi:hypothetical protein
MNDIFIKVGVAYVGALTIFTLLLTQFQGGL